MIYVFARDKNSFGQYCRMTKKNPNDPDLCYLSSYEKLKGVTNPRVVFYGDVSSRSDYSLIMDIIRQRTTVESCIGCRLFKVDGLGHKVTQLKCTSCKRLGRKDHYEQ
jgi:hypothetical protein